MDPAVWTPTRPSTGHCAVTAMLVAEYTDATTILRVPLSPEYGGSHYYNALPDRTEVDITKDQFDTYEPLGHPEERTFGYLLANESTLRRYELLRSRLKDHWLAKATVAVNRSDLLAVLKKVPGWVPMGAPGEGDWSSESLDAKDRLLASIGMTNDDLWGF